MILEGEWGGRVAKYESQLIQATATVPLKPLSDLHVLFLSV